MLEVLVFLTLSCAEPTKVNRTSFPWNEYDTQIESQCKKRCPEIYSDAPCLKQFIKYGKQDYDCICGAKASK